jgi:hypothetical protein
LAFQTGTDPEAAEQALLFHPRVDRWQQHFRWSDEGTHILALTAVGRATGARLQMKRQRMAEARRLRVQAGWHPAREHETPYLSQQLNGVASQALKDSLLSCKARAPQPETFCRRSIVVGALLAMLQRGTRA